MKNVLKCNLGQQVGHPASYVTTCIGLLTLLARVRTLACKWLSRRPLGHPSSLSSRRPCPWEEEEEAYTTPPRGQTVFRLRCSCCCHPSPRLDHSVEARGKSAAAASLSRQTPAHGTPRTEASPHPKGCQLPQKTGHDDQVRGLQVGGPLARADVEHVAGLSGFHCPSGLPWAYHAPWGWGLGSDTLSAAATSLDRGSVALQAIHFFSQSATCFPPQGRSSCPRTCSSSWSTTTRRGP